MAKAREDINRTDAIIDRITTNAHTTVITCDNSMRKHFNQLN